MWGGHNYAFTADAIVRKAIIVVVVVVIDAEQLFDFFVFVNFFLFFHVNFITSFKFFSRIL